MFGFFAGVILGVFIGVALTIGRYTEKMSEIRNELNQIKIDLLHKG